MADDRRRGGRRICILPEEESGDQVIGRSGNRVSEPSAEPGRRVFYIAYPLLTVSEASAGGAEQMLWTLERETASRGLSTTVAASAGSQVHGELLVTGEPCNVPDDFERRNREHQDRIVEFIRARERAGAPFDLVHDQSGSFWPRAAEIDTPVLATLHLPRHYYSQELFQDVPENVVFTCVSTNQARSFADLNPQVVLNGILLDRFQPNFGRRSGLLWLGRICEEKAPHLALEIAARSNERITVAGQVYPFSYHQQYFDREVAPRLEQMTNAVFISAPSAERKRQVLREARAVLITSVVGETSSLVAMEAAACGAPVIAFRRGALPDIVSDGTTGFLVDGVEEALDALKQVGRIESIACVARAKSNFSSAKMADRYETLYAQAVEKRMLYQVPTPQ